MIIAKSRLTAQFQINVPVAVGKRMGLKAGTVLEWREDRDGGFNLRRQVEATWEEIRRGGFPEGPPGRAVPVEEFDKGIEKYIRVKYDRR